MQLVSSIGVGNYNQTQNKYLTPILSKLYPHWYFSLPLPIAAYSALLRSNVLVVVVFSV